jgi:hypothetical protein
MLLITCGTSRPRTPWRLREPAMRLARTLIAQSSLDHDVPLITRDADVKRFAAVVGLRLLP